MSGVDRMRSQLGGNIRESMGAAATNPSAVLPGGVAHGVPARYQGIARPKEALTIELDRLHPDPDQPRKDFDPESLAALAASMKARGQLQPIRVRWDEAGSRWVIVAGERRYRAALDAGMPTLLCVEAKGNPTPDDILEDQIVENCVREDLRPVEQARAFRALMDRRGYSGRQLAETLNVSHMAVNRALALLNLPALVQERVERGELAPSVAYEVSKLADPAEQTVVAGLAVAEGLNRSEVVKAVRERSTGPKGRGAAAKPRKTSATMRASNGAKITVERRKPLDDDAIEAALAEVLEALRARKSTGPEAA